MSAPSSTSRFSPQAMKSLVSEWGPWLLVIAGVIGVMFGWQWLEHRLFAEHEEETTAVESDPYRVLPISETKWEQAAFVCSPVERRTVRPSFKALGEVTYDRNRQVTLVAPEDLIVEQLHVQIGDRVEAGAPLATVNGPAIGQARAGIVRLVSDCRLIDQRRQRARSIQVSLESLLAAVAQGATASQLTEQLQSQTIGDHRKTIIEAVSAVQLAESLVTQAQSAGGALADRVIMERTADRDVAMADLATVCENSKFSAEQELAMVEAEYRQHQQELAVALSGLARRLGLDSLTADDVVAITDDRLASWEIVAEHGGTVAALPVSPGARVRSGEPIAQLADLGRLWIKVWWRVNDRTITPPAPGTEVSFVSVNADSPDAPVLRGIGKVAFAETAFDHQTKAWPVVIEFEDADQVWRAGMLVRVSLPLGEASEQTVVPTAAVMNQAGETFVFEQTGQREYRRRDVVVEWSDDEIAVLQEGPAAGTTIVTENAFYLASELLLEGEE